MDIIKISLLLLCAGNVFSSPNKSSKSWQYNTRKMNSLLDQTQHCFCYPDGDLPVVNKLLDSEDHGLERLVVYLYKAINSNEIKMYTPSAEKQMLIPDIPYDSNDGLLTLTNENVDMLFYDNPYKIKVYNDRFETLNPTVVSSLPIGLHQGEIEHILPGANDDTNSNDNDSSNGYDYNAYANPQYNGYDDANLPQPEASPIKPLDFDSNGSPGNNLEPNQNTNPESLVPDQNWVDPNTNPDSLGPGQNWVVPNINSDGLRPGEHWVVPNTNLEGLGPDQNLVDPGTNPESLGPGQNWVVPNTNSDGLGPGQHRVVPNTNPESLGPDQNWVDPSTKPDGLESDQNWVVPNTNPESLGPDQNWVVPSTNIEGLGPDQHWIIPNKKPENFEEISAVLNANDLQDPLLPESQAFPLAPDDKLRSQIVYSFLGDLATSQAGTFDAWFKQQMKRFQHPHFPGDLKNIDSNLLKTLVVKIFSENKIYISTNGVITGPNGEIIDIANLELRALLLGEKINLEIFNNSEKKISLLKRLPFLEGILVTLVSPPQILGIIPLGKIYLTKSSIYMDQILGQLSAINSSKVYTSKYTDATVYLNPSQSTLNRFLSEPGKISVESISSISSAGNTGNWETNLHAQAVPLSNKETQLSRAGPYWNSGQYYSAPNVPYPNWNPLVEIQPLGQRRKSNVKIEHLVEPPPIKTRKKINDDPSTQKDTKTKVTTTITPSGNVNSTEPARRFSGPILQGMLKTLMLLLNDTPIRRQYQSKQNTTQNFDIISDSELTKYDEDGPDFRIIGGSAATGSGTPVSSKGRSGYNEEMAS
ncbi:uncharacterized protein LOC111354255 [Spodoptera litura]|uniref:Uncharacterized protein LOC111354255 n=1 Tax=Spodoptera litura TaxID=69820 RepID=A0A9J7E6V0_SPOLT|nr:uncharacterized protein LOC111354255 [Spodoptera litura]